MADDSQDKPIQVENCQRPLKHSFEEVLRKLLFAQLSDNKWIQFEEWESLCGFVITLWKELHKLFKDDPQLEEANFLRVLDQSAFLIAGFLKHRNFATLGSDVISAFSNSLRGVNKQVPSETVVRIGSFLRETVIKLPQRNEQEITVETIWEFLNGAAAAWLKLLGSQKVPLDYLLDLDVARQSNGDSEADLLFYRILEKRISLIRKIVEENRHRLRGHYTDPFANSKYILPLKTFSEGRTISVAFSERFSKNASSKIISKACVIVMRRIERLPYEYFTWVPLKSNYRVNDIDLRNEPTSLPFLEDYDVETDVKLSGKNDLFPSNSSIMNTDRISLAEKLFSICYKLTFSNLRKIQIVLPDRACSYSSINPETYLPQKETLFKNASLNVEESIIEALCTRLVKGSSSTMPAFQQRSLQPDSFEQLQDLGPVLRKWFCRKCYTYACGEHLPLEVSLPQQVFNLPYETVAKPVISPPCLNGCFSSSDASPYESFRFHDWTIEEVLAFQSFCRVFGNNWCDIASIFFQRHSCFECLVFAERNSFSRKKATKKNGQRKKNQSNRKSTVTLLDHVHCWHDDDCNSENCTCKKSELYCEKYCPCYLLTQGNCRNRAVCCSCKGGKCLNGQCPCFKENRECDPDNCSCFARFRTESKREDSQYTCKNIGIRTKTHKKLFIAPSDYHEGGWGLFTTEPIEKYEFICEYKGELVSLDECERREKSYQAITDMTFVFKKGDMHIDATRKGGKARFANEPGKRTLPNCYSCYKRTMGDLRVGIYADRNIEAGEEILFRYEC